MKKLSAVLALLLCFSCILSACDSETKKSDESEDLSEEVELSPEEMAYEKALSLIEEKKYKEAYTTLYNIRHYKKALLLMAKFEITPAYVKHTSLDENGNIESDYNVTREFDEYRNKISEKTNYIIENSNTTNSSTSASTGNDDYTIEYTYNSKGDVTIITYIYPDRIKTYELEYDEDGNLIKQNTPDNTFVITYRYNKDDNLIEQTTMYRNEVAETYKYEYDKNGNLTKETCVDQWCTVYEYDENGNLTKEAHTMFSDDGYLVMYEYEYDENDNIIKMISTDNYREDDNYSVNYIRDDKGNILYTENDSGERTSERTNTYDDKGNLIKTESKGSNWTDSYEYGENGLVLKYIQTGNSGTTITEFSDYNYKYVSYMPLDPYEIYIRKKLI